MDVIDIICALIPDSLEVRIFSEEEKDELLTLFKRANKIIARTSHKNIDEYHSLKSRINGILNGYRGEYLSYFKKRLRYLEDDEKSSLGYGIHSIM